MKMRAREEKKERLILKRLRATLLRLFGGQHGETVVSMKGMPVVIGTLEGQQPFRPNPNGVRDRTTTLKRLVIGPELSVNLNPNR